MDVPAVCVWRLSEKKKKTPRREQIHQYSIILLQTVESGEVMSSVGGNVGEVIIFPQCAA